MAFTYRDMGRAFHEYIFCVFSVMARWIADAFHAVLCLYFCVMGKTYWVNIPHNCPVHKELGNFCFGSVQYIKHELQALICDVVEI